MDENLFLEAAARITPQWVAGFFDGEGCVSVTVEPRYKNGMRVRVRITQKDITPLLLLRLKFPKSCGPYKKLRASEIVFYGENAAEFLEYIKDYVICKRSQVEAALELLSTFTHKVQIDEKTHARQIELVNFIAKEKRNIIE